MGTLCVATVDVTLNEYSNRKTGIIAHNLFYFYHITKTIRTVREIMRYFLIVNCSAVPGFSASEIICKLRYV